jgi:hypothetical protein
MTGIWGDDIIFKRPFPCTGIISFVVPFKQLAGFDLLGKELLVFRFYCVRNEKNGKPNALEMLQVGNNILLYPLAGIIVSKKAYQIRILQDN